MSWVEVLSTGRRAGVGKIFQLFLGLCFFGGSAVWAAELLGAPLVVPLAADAVRVRWRTDVPTGSRVAYGREADRLTDHAEGELTADHEVELTGLLPATEYFFEVGTARKKLGRGCFKTGDSPAAISRQGKGSPLAKSRPSTPVPPVGRLFSSPPPTSKTWGSLSSLPDHYARHGADFGAKNSDDYARMAWEFRQRAEAEHWQSKVDPTGVIRIYDRRTGSFGAYNRDGTTKTFFKPNSPDYFDRQPGKIVSL
ncbi:MAG: fibronectin type III domain-containing protein [Verrucomicrobiota bacterium]